MNKSVGFIGGGNMGKAMMGGMISANLVAAQNVWVYDQSTVRLNELKEEYGLSIAKNNEELIKNCDIIILAVKPNIYNIIINEIRPFIDDSKVIVSIAAGQTIDNVEKMFKKDIKLVRAMPNTPALVGEAMSMLCKNKNASDEELQIIKSIFESFGKAELIREDLIDAFIAGSGSAPAYVFMFIEAMADAVVLEGMPREIAYKICAQAVLGSAKMVLETGTHPGELKDMVCSPGGTTIEAVIELENKGMRNAVISAMRKCAEKSRDMSK